MEWFYKPKVQVGLLVNFAFVMFTLVSSLAGASTRGTRVTVEERYEYDATAGSGASAPAVADNAFRYVPLPPRLGPSQAASAYDSRSRQMSVYTPHDLTLLRKDGRTLTLSSIFYISGNGPIIPPRKVLLRFLSNAPNRVYADECELEITTEGEDFSTDFSAALTVSRGGSSKGGVMNVVESMGQEIPYPVFVRLITAKRVTLKLGGEEIVLSDEQLSALRDMQRCIQDGSCG